MSRKPFKLILAIVSLLYVLPGHTEVFKWVDSDGVVHFESQPPGNGKSEIVDVDVTRPPISNPASKYDVARAAPSKVETKPERKGKEKKVVMYGAAWCPYCKKAREYFRKKGIRFVEYDVERHSSRMREFKKMGGTGYPLILIGKNQQMQGFSVSGFDRRYNR